MPKSIQNALFPYPLEIVKRLLLFKIQSKQTQGVSKANHTYTTTLERIQRMHNPHTRSHILHTNTHTLGNFGTWTQRSPFVSLPWFQFKNIFSARIIVFFCFVCTYVCRFLFFLIWSSSVALFHTFVPACPPAKLYCGFTVRAASLLWIARQK